MFASSVPDMSYDVGQDPSPERLSEDKALEK
jgi:hypothetical protein